MSAPSTENDKKYPVTLQNCTLKYADGLDRTVAGNTNKNIDFNKSNEIKSIISRCLYKIFLWSIAKKKYNAIIPANTEILDAAIENALIINASDGV